MPNLSVAWLLRMCVRICAHAAAGEVYKKFLWLGAWGELSPKPTYLYSNRKWIEELAKELPTQRKWKGANAVVRRYLDSTGRRRVTGGTLLKQTQSGPQLSGILARRAPKPHVHHHHGAWAHGGRGVTLALSDVLWHVLQRSIFALSRSPCRAQSSRTHRRNSFPSR